MKKRKLSLDRETLTVPYPLPSNGGALTGLLCVAIEIGVTILATIVLTENSIGGDCYTEADAGCSGGSCQSCGPSCGYTCVDATCGEYTCDLGCHSHPCA